MDEEAQQEEATSGESQSDEDSHDAFQSPVGPSGLILLSVACGAVALLLVSLNHARSARDTDFAAEAAAVRQTGRPEEVVLSPLPAAFPPQATTSAAKATPAPMVAPPVSILATIAPVPPPPTIPPPHCGVDEEMFAGLCYRKCSLLTDNEFPVRFASNACQKKAEGMNPPNPLYDGTLCDGFSVGDEEACPHAPFVGSCDDNEEMHAGACYKKCELLTDGKFNVRWASNTCCSEWPCGADPSKMDTQGIGCQGYGVGGGGNGHECAHPPWVINEAPD